MYFKPIFMSVALSSFVALGVSQTINATNSTIKADSYTKANQFNLKRAGHLEPFNPKAFKHQYNGVDSDYYAYYGNGAFQTPNQADTYGFILDMGATSMIYLWGAYNAALQYHAKNPYAWMISYLTGDDPYKTPYAGGWSLDNYFFQDADTAQRTNISLALALYPSGSYHFITNAQKYNYNVSFYLYCEVVHSGNTDTVYVKDMLGNDQTKAMISTPWYPKEPIS